MKLTLIGTGTPTPDIRRAGSSYLLEMDDDSVLIDCGPGSFRRLQEAGVKVTDINTVCLTHLHYDHCVDFACLLLSRWDQGAGKIPELDVIGPPGTAAFTEALVGEKGAFNPDLEARTLHPMSQEVYEERGGVLPRERPHPRVTEVVSGSTVARNGWRLTAAEGVHAQPYLTCLAYRVEALGKSIVFGGDSAPVDALTRLSKGADALLHMCHFFSGTTDDPRVTKTCSGHLDAAATARDAGVGKLVLVHLTKRFEGQEAIARLRREVTEIFPGKVVVGSDLEAIAL